MTSRSGVTNRLALNGGVIGAGVGGGAGAEGAVLLRRDLYMHQMEHRVSGVLEENIMCVNIYIYIIYREHNYVILCSAVL